MHAPLDIAKGAIWTCQKTRSGASFTTFSPSASLRLLTVPSGTPSQTRLAWKENSAKFTVLKVFRRFTV